MNDSISLGGDPPISGIMSERHSWGITIKPNRSARIGWFVLGERGEGIHETKLADPTIFTQTHWKVRLEQSRPSFFM